MQSIRDWKAEMLEISVQRLVPQFAIQVHQIEPEGAIMGDVSPLIHVGNKVRIEVDIKDTAEFPPVLADPDSATIDLLFPDGTAAVTHATMTKIRTGVYQFGYQTSTDSSHGEYVATVKIVKGTDTNLLPFVAFVLIQ